MLCFGQQRKPCSTLGVYKLESPVLYERERMVSFIGRNQPGLSVLYLFFQISLLFSARFPLVWFICLVVYQLLMGYLMLNLVKVLKKCTSSFQIFFAVIWYHHHVVPLARISLTFSRHFSLSFIAFGRSSGLHPVSSHSCCMYVRAGHPAFYWPYAGVHRSTSLMSSSLLLQ